MANYDKDKIILMARIAVYEKNEGPGDAKKMTYFINDFAYRRNAGLRAGVLVGCLILILLYALHKIVVENADFITGINYPAEISKICVFTVCVMIAYSVLGTVVHMLEYRKSSKRIQEYIDDLEKLETLSQMKDVD